MNPNINERAYALFSTLHKNYPNESISYLADMATVLAQSLDYPDPLGQMPNIEVTEPHVKFLAVGNSIDVRFPKHEENYQFFCGVTPTCTDAVMAVIALNRFFGAKR